MKLWLLNARDDLPADEELNPWEPWYDCKFGFVVRAETEADARALADRESGQEGEPFEYPDNLPTDAPYRVPTNHPWLDPALSTCEELTPDGKAGIILEDMRMA